MSANSALQVTSFDFDTIRGNLKTYLSSQQEFVDYNFDGSTISLLLDTLAYNTYLNSFQTNMVGNEMYLDSAQMRNSVVSRAKMLDYTPNSAKGATAKLKIVVEPDDNPSTVLVAGDTQFTSQIDGVTYKFVTPQPYTITANTSGSFSATVDIVEGEPLTHKFTVSSSNPVRYILPNANVDTTSMRVYVEESNTNSTQETFVLADDITDVTSMSKIYFLQEVDDEQFEIYFGDGIIGSALKDGNVVIVKYRVCNGTTTNGADNFTLPSTIGGYSTFTSTVVSAAAGGADAESIESIKFNAPKSYESQNRAVLVTDYERLILRENSDISQVAVWGGEENNPPIYGKVFIAVKPTTGTIVSQSKKNDIKKQLKSRNVVSIDPEFVDASYLYVVPSITVHYESHKTTLSASAIRDLVDDEINKFEIEKLGRFSADAHFKYSRFTAAVDSIAVPDTHNITTVQIQKRFKPSVVNMASYMLPFNNSIRSGQPNNVSSTAFGYQSKVCYLNDDGKGAIRIYTAGPDDTAIYLDSNAGSVDYKTGLILLTSFLPDSFSGYELKLNVIPANYDIYPIRNQLLLLADSDITMIDNDTHSVLPAVTIETLGTNTTADDSSVGTIVY